jgi:hypothetical protein
MPKENAGPLAGATALLLDCLRATGMSADLGQPDGFDQPGLLAWPIALLPENVPSKGNAPLRMRLRYLVCAGGPASVALAALDRVLVTDQPYLVPAEVPAALWQALGLPHRIGLFFDVPVHFDRPIPTAPRVTAAPQLRTASLQQVSGQVVAPGGVPLAGMNVATADGIASTYTDTKGRFQLPCPVTDQPLRLVVTGRGLRLSAEVPAVPAEPVVITCEI